MDFKYYDELYQNGQDIYASLYKKVESLVTSFNNAISEADEIENQHAKVEYTGLYQETIKNIEENINSLKESIEIVKENVEEAKELVDKYNEGEIDQSEILFRLNDLQGNSTVFGLGDSLDKDLNYSNIYDDGFTPQGLTIVGDKVFISAYDPSKDKKEPSRIYLYDINDPSKPTILVLDTDAHVGGITYDEKNHVLLVTDNSGYISAYDYDEIRVLEHDANSGTANKTNKPVKIRLNHSPAIIDSNINMNYETLDNGNRRTGYNAATVYYDNETNTMYIGRFAQNGKIIAGQVEYNRETKTYNLVNPTSVDADEGIQGISIYHKDNKTYLVESRSFGSNQSQVTVKDISNGLDNQVIVGSKQYNNLYGEGIHIDETGKGTMVHESGKWGNYDTTSTIDVNEIIEENNHQNNPVIITTDKYEVGEPEDKPNGYNI